MRKLVLIPFLALVYAGCEEITEPGRDVSVEGPQFSSTAVADAVDQEQTQQTAWVIKSRIIAPTGQTFTPSVNKLTAFEFLVCVSAGSQFEFSIVHWADQTTLTTFTATLPGICGVVGVHLPSPVDLIPGDRYALLLLSGPSISFNLHDNTGKPEGLPPHDHYPDGHFVDDGAEVWWADAVFKTYYPAVLDVAIDIKPGSDPNSINLGSNGTVPVAIFSTETFDATTVDATSVTLADAAVTVKGKGTPMTAEEDVNGDGLMDLVVHVETEGLSLTEGDTEAVLTGTTQDGMQIRGTDTVRVVP